MGAFIRRLLALVRRTRLERDLDDELAFHLAMRREEHVAECTTPEQAQGLAHRQFGSLLLTKERTRDAWRFIWLDTFLQDIRYALRTMRRAPGFAVIAVGSSALGIGACSVTFAVLSFALFTPLPVDDPDRLLGVSVSDRRSGQVVSELSYPDYLDLREAATFEGVAAVNPLVPASIGVAGEPQRHWGALVTANYFDVVKPAFASGRGFDTIRDDTPGEAPVVVLSHALWQRGFAGDPTVVGQPISINGRFATVVGVTSAGFRGTNAGFMPEFWMPFSMIDELRVFEGIAKRVMENRERYWLNVVARVRPNLDERAARAELDVIAQSLNVTHVRNDDRGFFVERAGQIDPGLRRMALSLFSVAFAVTVLVLLLSCSNVANLLLGRAATRRREVAARIALGASRFRLLRQLLTESLLLALMGGLGGWIIAGYLSSLFGLIRVPLGWPLDLSISPDYRLLLFCAALSLVTGIAFGLVPALRATRPDLMTDLKANTRGGILDRVRLRDGLVVAQVAICTLLLLGMGLFLRSLQAARGMESGMGNRNVLLLAFDPALGRRSDTESRQLMGDLLDRVRAIPGIESATLTSAVPLTLMISNSRFVPAEQAKNPEARRIPTDIYAVGSEFFDTLGISVLAGEQFPFASVLSATSAIVNDTFARMAFPGQSAIGRRVLGDGKALDIVGVVATVKSRSIGEEPRPSLYLPLLATYTAKEMPRGITLAVRTSGAPAGYTGPVRETIRRVDESVAVFDVRTMESHVEDALLVPRLARAMSAAAGLVGLVLALIGIYGVVSFAVVRRRKELGIRMAVGAEPRHVLQMVLRQGLGMVATGVAIGMLVAFGVTRFAVSVLYGVRPADPLTFIVVPSILVAVAILACLVPARRAARLDAVEILRSG